MIDWLTDWLHVNLFIHTASNKTRHCTLVLEFKNSTIIPLLTWYMGIPNLAGLQSLLGTRLFPSKVNKIIMWSVCFKFPNLWSVINDYSGSLLVNYSPETIKRIDWLIDVIELIHGTLNCVVPIQTGSGGEGYHHDWWISPNQFIEK